MEGIQRIHNKLDSYAPGNSANDPQGVSEGGNTRAMGPY
jgi:hypothetical protein